MRTMLFLLCCVWVITVQAQNWVQQTSNVSSTIRSIAPVDAQNVWASTNDGKIIRTNNGGSTWVVKTNPHTNYPIYSIAAVSASVAWASLVEPTNLVDWRIAKTTDGGTTWTEQLINSGSFGLLVHYWDSNNGIIIGEPSSLAPSKWIIKKTQDGGTTYQDIASANIPLADTVSNETANVYSVSVSGDVISFISRSFSDSLFVPKLYLSTNRGISWIKKTVSVLSNSLGFVNLRVSFKDSIHGVLCTNNGKVFTTTDGGSNWTAQVDIPSTSVVSIQFVSQNVYLVSSSTGTIVTSYISINDGVSWKRLETPATITGGYVQKFVNDSTGWFGGINGSIAKWNGGPVTYYPGQVQVKFMVDMKYPAMRGEFTPGRDAVQVRGTWNSWGTTDTLTDNDHDLVYEKMVTMDYFYRQEYKFYFYGYYNAQDFWESDPNRNYLSPQPFTVVNVGDFNSHNVVQTINTSNAIPLTSGQTYWGNTATGQATVNSYYNCSWNESGKENIFRISVTELGRLSVALGNITSNLDVFILKEGKLLSTLAFGDRKCYFTDAQPGDYYIVVDGRDGAEGSYSLFVELVTGRPAGDVVWTENFEGNVDANWHAEPDTWQWGRPRSGPWEAYTGKRVAKTILEGDYAESGISTRLIRHSSFTVPSAIKKPVLQFTHRYSFSCGDQGELQIKPEGGNWQSLITFTGYSGHYWKCVNYDLSAYSGQNVQIGFYFYASDCCCSWDGSWGWLIDDLSLTTEQPYSQVADSLEDFESGQNGWLVDGQGWFIGVPTYGGSPAHSGNKIAGVDLDDNYWEGMNTSLYSPAVLIPRENALLRFYHKYSFNCGDGGNLQVKSVKQSTWNNIASFGGTSQGDWNWAYYDLNSFADSVVQIRFQFTSSDCCCSNDISWGWAVDDVLFQGLRVPKIVVTNPYAKTPFSAGKFQEIRWGSSMVNKVKIELSTNNGGLWSTLADSVDAKQQAFRWIIPNIPSQNCRIKISDIANPSVYGLSDTTFSIVGVTPSINWQANLTVKNAGNQMKNLVFGTGADATNGIDFAYNEYELPPVPPAEIYDVRWQLPVTPVLASMTDFRKTNSQNLQWNIAVQAGSSGYPITVTWDKTLLPSGEFLLKDAVTGNLLSVDMKAVGTCTITNSAITALKIVSSQQKCVTIPVASSWGLYAAPIAATNLSAAAVFPFSMSPVFGFSGTDGYTAETLLSLGKGYWVNYPMDTTTTLCGSLAASNTVTVKAGWNIMGVYNDTVSVNQISGQGLTVSSSFFGYQNGYTSAATLRPGKGYWVKVSANGFLQLPAGGSLAKGGVPVTVSSYPANWKTLAITDAKHNSTTLYLADKTVKAAEYELPPLPPQGVFDARFADQSNAACIANAEQEISISGACYPVTISSTEKRVLVRDKATSGKVINQVIDALHPLVVNNHAVTSLQIAEVEIPKEYALEQNYPNPFNPATTIGYRLPEKSRVRIAVYNSLGQVVAVLVDEEKDAGVYTVEWNASRFSSGIYYYQMKTDAKVFVKKLLLIK